MSEIEESKPRSLKLKEWPAADQAAWREAIRKGGRLSRGGRASHMKPVTKQDLEKRYGLFLGHIQRVSRHATWTNNGPACYVREELVVPYLAELQARVSTVTVYGCIYKLRRMAELLDPALDLAWLRGIEQVLEDEMRPQPKLHRIVESDRILEAGIEMMKNAEGKLQGTAIRRATVYRDGLMIALLSLCPLRLKNFTALTIGQNIERLDTGWWIRLNADETKSRRPDERAVPNVLSPYLDRYVACYRAAFNSVAPALWIGRLGKPLGYLAVEKNISETTRRAFGNPIGPHLFRACAATTAYLHASDTPHLASGLLQHTDQKVTEQHYNRSGSAAYGKAFSDLIEK